MLIKSRQENENEVSEKKVKYEKNESTSCYNLFCSSLLVDKLFEWYIIIINMMLKIYIFIKIIFSESRSRNPFR